MGVNSSIVNTTMNSMSQITNISLFLFRRGHVANDLNRKQRREKIKMMLIRDFRPGDLVWFDPGVGYVLPGEVVEFHKAAQVRISPVPKTKSLICVIIK